MKFGISDFLLKMEVLTTLFLLSFKASPVTDELKLFFLEGPYI
jgi:hypothetical protein